jgi:hypothetical protein
LKQFVIGWLVGNKSTYNELQKKFKSIDNTRNAYNVMGIISIENPKLWGMIRSVDAISRSQNVVQTYSDWGQLYLDGRDEEFSQAMSKKPGVFKNTESNKEKEIFPHVMLYICGLTAEQISVKDTEKFDTNKTGEAEKNLAKCLYAYAHGASTGGNDANNQNEAQLMWRERQTKALSEALFQSLLMATKNNYKSTQEYNSKDDNNIVSLTKGLKNTSTSRDDYAALAKIVNYSTQQMLEVVDADALNLQTEIIKDLQSFDEGYFGSIGEN